jgi:hypothetical protein
MTWHQRSRDNVTDITGYWLSPLVMCVQGAQHMHRKLTEKFPLFGNDDVRL